MTMKTIYQLTKILGLSMMLSSVADAKLKKSIPQSNQSTETQCVDCLSQEQNIQPKITSQVAAIGDAVIISKAVNELDPNALEVQEIPNLVVICDPEIQGDDCQARIVTLNNGESKMLVKATKDYGSIVKTGEILSIKPENLLYVDRSKKTTCNTIPGRHNAFRLTDAISYNEHSYETVNVPPGKDDFYLSSEEIKPFTLELWDLKRALDNKEVKWKSFTKETSLVKWATNHKHTVTFDTKTAIIVGDYWNNGSQQLYNVVCSEKSFLKVIPRTIVIPTIDMKKIGGH